MFSYQGEHFKFLSVKKSQRSLNYLKNHEFHSKFDPLLTCDRVMFVDSRNEKIVFCNFSTFWSYLGTVYALFWDLIGPLLIESTFLVYFQPYVLFFATLNLTSPLGSRGCLTLRKIRRIFTMLMFINHFVNTVNFMLSPLYILVNIVRRSTWRGTSPPLVYVKNVCLPKINFTLFF